MGASPPKAIDAAPAKETVRFVGIVRDREENAPPVLRPGAYDKRNVERWSTKAAEPRRTSCKASISGRRIRVGRLSRKNQRRSHPADIQAARTIGWKLKAPDLGPLCSVLVGGARDWIGSGGREVLY